MTPLLQEGRETSLGAQGQPVPRLDALDLLRGLCALAVAVFHFDSWGGLQIAKYFDGWLAVCGTYGVSVFFVLSGYSLAHAYGARFANGIEADAILRYARRRIGRLLPLFSVILIASLAGRIISGAEPALSPVIGGWSIGIEVVFYVAFPLLLALRRYFVGERILPPQPIHFAALLAAAIMASVAVDRLLDKPLQQRIKNAGW